MSITSMLRPCIGMWLLVSLQAGAAVGREPMPLTPESVRRAAADSEAAVAAFLDPQAEMEERLNASARIGIPSEADANRLLAVAADAMQPDEVRSRSMILGGRRLPERSSRVALDILKSTAGGPELRAGAVQHLAQQLEFSKVEPDQRTAYLGVLRDVVSPKEPPEVRQAAVGYLAAKGDDVAVKAIKDSISKAEGALVDPVLAVEYAKANNPEEYLRELNAAFDSNDPKMRAAAVPVLASYEQFRTKVRQTILNDEQPFEVRQAAIQAVGVYAPETIRDYLKLAGDEQQNEELRAECVLQIRGLQERYGKKFDQVSPIPKQALDKELKTLIESKSSQRLHSAGQQYFQTSE